MMMMMMMFIVFCLDTLATRTAWSHGKYLLIIHCVSKNRLFNLLT